MTTNTKLKDALDKHNAVMSKFYPGKMRNLGELTEVQDSQNELLYAIASALIESKSG